MLLHVWVETLRDDDQVYVCRSVYVCVRPCVTEVSAANVFGLSSK